MRENNGSKIVRAVAVLSGMLLLHLAGITLVGMAVPAHPLSYSWEEVSRHFASTEKLPTLQTLSALTGIPEEKALPLGWQLTALLTASSLLGFLVPGLMVFWLTRQLEGRWSWRALLLCGGLVLVIYPVVDGTAILMEEWLHKTGLLPPSVLELGRRSEGIMVYLLSWTAHQGITGVLLSVMSMCVLPALSEELFFRGAMFTALETVGMRRWLAIVVTAVAFALWHLSPSKFVSILLAGVVLGYLRAVSGGLLLPIVFHFSHNLLRVLVALSTHHTAALTAPVRWAVEQPVFLFLLLGAGAVILVLLHRTLARHPAIPSA